MSYLNPIFALTDVIRKYQKTGMVVAEIGTYDGTTTKDYIDIIKQNNGHLYAIDWFNGNENVEGNLHTFNEDNSDNVYQQFVNNIHTYMDITTIKRGKSSDMIPEIPDGSLDICFIDADHRYLNVYKDIEMCLPKIKPGGIICGHDFDDMSLLDKLKPEWLELDTIDGVHYGVIKAVYDHFGYDVESIPDPNGQRYPIWLKQL